MWHKKRAKILSTQKHVWPPDDWPRDKEDDKIKVNPKRLTYIDDIYKWCHCYNDPKKAQALIEGKNIDVKDYQPPKQIV